MPAMAPTKSMDMVIINCRPVNKNGHKLKDYIVDQDCDITAIKEAWLQEEEARSEQNVKDMCPKGYKMPHKPCTTGHRGGGMGLLHKGNLNTSPFESEPFESFEYGELLLKSNSMCIRIIVFYRPPPSPDNHLTIRQFLNESSSFLE